VIRGFTIGFILLWGVGACVATRADTADIARLGFVWPVGEAETPTKEFWERLRVLGWEEGRNLTVERRWAEGRIERLPELMAEVLARKVDVIVTVSTPGAMAAKAATATVPIVAGAIGDPVQVGLAQSLARPGGNLTGLSYGFSEGFAGKWLELLRECVPQLKTVALLYNPRNPWAVEQRKELETAIAALGLKVDLIEVTRSESLSAGLAQARRAQGLIVVADPLTYQLRSEIASIATRQRLPMIASMLEFVDAGGLLSYGVDNAAVLRRMAEYVDKILRGAKPADLPIEQPTQLALAVNLKTAAALGIKIPAAILGRADKVIR